jgi:hypothetical protein
LWLEILAQRTPGGLSASRTQTVAASVGRLDANLVVDSIKNSVLAAKISVLIWRSLIQAELDKFSSLGSGWSGTDE